jgi:hypothetical protein
MERSELNAQIRRFRGALEANAETNSITLSLLEILEMLIDRREEDDLLVKQRLEEIISAY